VNMVKGMMKKGTFATLARFYSDEGGATAIEYAIIASGIGAFLAATVYGLGGKVKDLFTTLSNMF